MKIRKRRNRRCRRRRRMIMIMIMIIDRPTDLESRAGGRWARLLPLKRFGFRLRSAMYIHMHIYMYVYVYSYIYTYICIYCVTVGHKTSFTVPWFGCFANWFPQRYSCPEERFCSQTPVMTLTVPQREIPPKSRLKVTLKSL